MIKNLNYTLSLISLVVILFLSIKFGLGLIFSSHRTDTIKGNLALLKDYHNNEEE